MINNTTCENWHEDSGSIDNILAETPDGIHVVDTSLRCVYVNRSGADMLGYSQSDMLGKTWRELGLTPEFTEPIEKRLHRVFSSGEVIKAGLSFNALDVGKDYECIIVPFCTEVEKIGSALISIRDVTSKTRTSGIHVHDKGYSYKVITREQPNVYEIQQNDVDNSLSKTLGAIFDNTNASIAYLDTDFNLVMISNGYAHDLGLSRDEIIGRNHFDLYPSSENETIFMTVRDTGETVQFKAKPFERGDSFCRQVTYWDWILAPLKQDDGNVVGLVLSQFDVTQTVQAKQLSDALNDINVGIGAALDVDEIIRIATVKAARALDCETATVLIRKKNRWITRHLYRGTNKRSSIERYNDQNKPEPETIVKEENSSSLLSVPLFARDELIGNIKFQCRPGSSLSSEVRSEFISRLAATISLAFENTRLYESKSRIADTLQEALLTMPEKIRHVEFCHLYHSATESARVGGDFYDLFEIDAHRIGMVIGDVSGKGLEAASMTAIARNTLRAYALEGYSPEIVMAKANNAIREASGLATFVTTIFAILDVLTGRLVYCNAGHSPAIVRRATGTELLEAHSPIIGAFEGLAYDVRETAFNKGDIVIMYTDGVIEARYRGKFYSEERLVSFIESLSTTAINDIPRVIFKEIMRFTSGDLSDDLAILAIARNDLDG